MTVLTLGEILLRLSPPGHDRFVQATRFEAEYGGSEANVAVALARWGMDSAFATKFPENALGQAAAGHLRRYGVDTAPSLLETGTCSVAVLADTAFGRDLPMWAKFEIKTVSQT